MLDFGISKDQQAPGRPTLTATASILGSPAYMAPEQLRDARTVDARADVWAIGVVLYELLAGELPFRAANVADMCVAILEHDLVPLRSLRRDVPDGLEQVILRCLARDPGERFPDVASLAKALVPFAPPGTDTAAERIRHVLQSTAGPAADLARSQLSRRRRFRTVALVATAGLAATAATCLANSSLVPLPEWARERTHHAATPITSPQAP